MSCHVLNTQMYNVKHTGTCVNTYMYIYVHSSGHVEVCTRYTLSCACPRGNQVCMPEPTCVRDTPKFTHICTCLCELTLYMSADVV